MNTEQNPSHPAYLGYVNTALAGWNLFLMIGFFLMIALSTASTSLFGETPVGGVHFWIAAVISVGVAGLGAYHGARRLRAYFRGLGLVGNCVWLTILMYLTLITFPGRFSYAM